VVLVSIFCLCLKNRSGALRVVVVVVCANIMLYLHLLDRRRFIIVEDGPAMLLYQCVAESFFSNSVSILFWLLDLGLEAGVWSSAETYLPTFNFHRSDRTKLSIIMGEQPCCNWTIAGGCCGPNNEWYSNNITISYTIHSIRWFHTSNI
jgi:hypothetical protein